MLLPPEKKVKTKRPDVVPFTVAVALAEQNLMLANKMNTSTVAEDAEPACTSVPANGERTEASVHFIGLPN